MNENQNQPQRPQRNPAVQVVLWLVAAVIILVIVGSCINAQHHCPSGTYWDSTSQACQ